MREGNQIELKAKNLSKYIKNLKIYSWNNKYFILIELRLFRH